MTLGHNSKVVTSGLGLYVDADNEKSTTGGDWKSLVEDTTFAKTGTPVVTTLGGAACYRFTAVGQYFSGNPSFLNNQPYPSTTLTMEAWIYPETEVIAGDRANICRINSGSAAYMSWNKSNRKLSNYWYGHSPEGYHETGAAMARDQWHHVCSVWTGTTLYQYTDLTQTSVSVTGSADATNSIYIGWEGDSRQFAGGIALVRMYNIALTQNQVIQNYMASRGRFGL